GDHDPLLHLPCRGLWLAVPRADWHARLFQPVLCQRPAHLFRCRGGTEAALSRPRPERHPAAVLLGPAVDRRLQGALATASQSPLLGEDRTRHQRRHARAPRQGKRGSPMKQSAAERRDRSVTGPAWVAAWSILFLVALAWYLERKVEVLPLGGATTSGGAALHDGEWLTALVVW